MKITLFMAMSVNGMIAREDGSEDFLSEENWRTFSGFVREFGNFIVGSRTYEAVKGWNEGYGFDDFPEAHRVVVSDFAQANLIDEVVLNVEPTVIGQGIPLFRRAGFDLPLEFVETKSLSNGILQLRYRIK